MENILNKIHPALRELLHPALDRDRNVIQSVSDHPAPTGLAGRLYCERRRREAWFDAGMFWEPGWDLLLYMYDAFEAGQTSLSIISFSNAPFAVSEESTARWLELLVVHGYIVLAKAAESVSLTPKATTAIRGFLNTCE